MKTTASDGIWQYLFYLAFDSMAGCSPSAVLNDVVEIARRDFGFRLSLDDAERLLSQSGEFVVTRHQPSDLCLVRRANQGKL